jgi:hypothetical protein
MAKKKAYEGDMKGSDNCPRCGRAMAKAKIKVPGATSEKIGVLFCNCADGGMVVVVKADPPWADN